MGALVGILAAQLARTPVKIYSTGGLKYLPGPKGFLDPILKNGEFCIIGMCDAVFLVNREDQNLLENSEYKDKASYVGPLGGCGIDVTRFNSRARLKNRPRARNELGVKNGDFVIGYTGRMVWEKGFRDLINAASLIKERNVLFLLFGEGDALQEITQYARDKGVASIFRFEKYTFDINYLMAAFDMFVLPSYREGLPVSLLESMALGLPCVGTNIRGTRELIRDGETGIPFCLTHRRNWPSLLKN